MSAVGALLVAWFAAASLFLAVGAAVAPISRFERLLCALAAVAGAVSAVLVVGGALR